MFTRSWMKLNQTTKTENDNNRNNNNSANALTRFVVCIRHSGSGSKLMQRGRAIRPYLSYCHRQTSASTAACVFAIIKCSTFDRQRTAADNELVSWLRAQRCAATRTYARPLPNDAFKSFIADRGRRRGNVTSRGREVRGLPTWKVRLLQFVEKVQQYPVYAKMVTMTMTTKMTISFVLQKLQVSYSRWLMEFLVILNYVLQNWLVNKQGFRCLSEVAPFAVSDYHCHDPRACIFMRKVRKTLMLLRGEFIARPSSKWKNCHHSTKQIVKTRFFLLILSGCI